MVCVEHVFTLLAGGEPIPRHCYGDAVGPCRICVLDFGLMTEVTPDQRLALVEYIAHLSTRVGAGGGAAAPGSARRPGPCAG